MSWEWHLSKGEKTPRKERTLVLFAVVLLLISSACRAPEDRTEKIDWRYAFDTNDPVQKIFESEYHPELPNHGPILAPPTIAGDGTVYLLRPHESSKPHGPSLLAFGPVQYWELSPDSGVCTIPAVADDGTILFGTDAGSASAASPEGKILWTFAFPATAVSPSIDLGGGMANPARSPACNQPAIAADGTTYWVAHGVYALSRDGKLRWASEADSDFAFVSIGTDGTVYALANGRLVALASDGTERWKISLPRSQYFTGAIAIGQDGTIYLTMPIDPDLDITAVTPRGELKRRYRAESGSFVIGSTLIAAEGTIYATKKVLNQTYAVALDPDGKEKWTRPKGSETFNLASDGTLHFLDVNDLVAMDSGGRILWKARLPQNPNEVDAFDPSRAVTLAPDGRFYIGDFIGRLGTLNTSPGLASAGWPSRFHDARNTCRAGAR